MKQKKRIAIAALAITALGALAGAPSASASTIAITGVPQNRSLEITTSLAPGGSVLLTDTFGASANTCTQYEETKHTVAPFSGTTVNLAFTHLLISGCTEGSPSIDSGGTSTIERISGTSNGTVRSNGTKITWPSFFGTITCTTSNTDIGTITGAKEGSATMDLNGVLSCSLLGSVRISGTLVLTSPHAVTMVP